MNVKWKSGNLFVDTDTNTEYEFWDTSSISLEVAKDKILTHRVNALTKLAREHYDGQRYTIHRTRKLTESEALELKRRSKSSKP